MLVLNSKLVLLLADLQETKCQIVSIGFIAKDKESMSCAVWIVINLFCDRVDVFVIVNGVHWLLGDNESGKTTLVSKFRGVEEEKKGAALEYAYVAVKDEYGDGAFLYVL